MQIAKFATNYSLCVHVKFKNRQKLLSQDKVQNIFSIKIKMAQVIKVQIFGLIKAF